MALEIVKLIIYSIEAIVNLAVIIYLVKYNKKWEKKQPWQEIWTRNWCRWQTDCSARAFPEALHLLLHGELSRAVNCKWKLPVWRFRAERTFSHCLQHIRLIWFVWSCTESHRIRQECCGCDCHSVSQISSKAWLSSGIGCVCCICCAGQGINSLHSEKVRITSIEDVWVEITGKNKKQTFSA